MIKRKLLTIAAALGFTALLPAAANAVCFPWYCPTPPPTTTFTAFASDNFNRDTLGPNWVTAGPGAPYIANNELSGVGLPSDPQSYAYWATPTTGDYQDVTAVVRWDGRNPAHSCFGPVVRAALGSSATAATGVMFWATDNVMGIAYQGPSGVLGASGTQRFTSTTKFREGAVMELKVTPGTNGSDTYTALVDGVVRMQGAIPTTSVPRSQHSVGLGEQDDAAVSGGGESPASLDDFTALQGS